MTARGGSVTRHADERGASSVEYALLAVLIAVVIISSVTLLGIGTKGLFEKACSSVPTYTAGPSC